MPEERPAGLAPPPLRPSPARSFAFHRNLTLTASIVGYMGYYLCRQNLAAAYPVLHAQIGLEKETFGLVVSVGTLVYAIGKLVTGPLADSRGGRSVFFVGLFGSAAATLCIGGTARWTLALLGFWCVNRLFQSAGWGGLLSVLSRWYRKADYGVVSGALSVSYQLGGAVAAGVCALLTAWGWRALFVGPAVLLAALGVALLPILHGAPEEVGHTLPAAPADPSAAAVDDAAEPDRTHSGKAVSPIDGPVPSLARRVGGLLGNPAFLLVCALSFVLTLVRETFNTWLPAYFNELGTGADAANVKSALFPILGCAGTFLAGWVSDRLTRGRRGPVMAVFLVGATLSLLGLAHPDAVARVTHLSRDVAILGLTGATGFFILAPYSMVGGGVLALDAGGPKAAATAAGLLDSIGYVGATAAGWGVASAVARAGWGRSFALLSAAVAACAVLSVVLWLALERRRPSR